MERNEEIRNTQRKKERKKEGDKIRKKRMEGNKEIKALWEM